MSKKYHHSRQWIQTTIHHYQPEIKKSIPREVILVIDATFFGRRVDKFGLIVAKDVLKADIVSYHFITTESISEYQIILQQLKQEGFTIKAVVIDGKRGLFRLLKDIPVQMCHFHQQAIITRYLTKKPKMKASQDLKRICSYLGKVEEKRFELLLKYWHKKHEKFIKGTSKNSRYS